MIKLTSENGKNLRIDPDDIAAVSLCPRDPEQAEVMLLDGRRIRVLGTVADVFAEIEKDGNDGRVATD
jgi:uncharacterized protein YlzI (FlbEa/FlbD family)